MKQPWSQVGVIALAGVCLGGCGDYRIVRWPHRTLWTGADASAPEIELPEMSLEAPASGGRVTQAGVTAAMEFIETPQARDLLHADFQRRHIQPVVIAVKNESDAPYVFSKANLDRDYIPAEDAGRLACPHPLVTVVRYARWLALFFPGLLIESVIEPATTLDFPKFEELASRPPIPDRRVIRGAFARAEIADGPIAPGEERRGLLFLHPPQLGRTIPMTLINPQTQASLVLEIPTPEPVYREVHLHPYPSAIVWKAVTQAAHRMKSWYLVSADPAAGVLTSRKGFRFLGWNTVMRLTVAVKATDGMRTQVALDSTLRRRDSTALGQHSRAVETFFSEIEGFLPAPAPSPATKPPPAT